jgi:hypothetical protein
MPLLPREQWKRAVGDRWGEQTAERMDDLEAGITGEQEGEVGLLGVARWSIAGKYGVCVTDC